MGAGEERKKERGSSRSFAYGKERTRWGAGEGTSSSLHFYQELVLLLNKFMPLHSLIALAYNDLLL